MTVLELVYAWTMKNVPWLGYIVMSVLGGIVAHIRDWEKRNPGSMTVRNHFWALVRRTFYAVMASALWYLIMKEHGWEARPYAHMGAGIVGMFASEWFDWLWGQMKSRMGAKIDAKEQEKTKE